MNQRPLTLVLADLGEEAACTTNDLAVLGRVAWLLEEMRGNNVPRDLFIRIRGGVQYTPPWDVALYAAASAVQDYHRDDSGGRWGAVTGDEEVPFALAPVTVSDPWV